jgi:hypothetical protein
VEGAEIVGMGSHSEVSETSVFEVVRAAAAYVAAAVRGIMRTAGGVVIK